MMTFPWQQALRGTGNHLWVECDLQLNLVRLRILLPPRFPLVLSTVTQRRSQP